MKSSAPRDQKAELAESRRRTQGLQVAALQPGLKLEDQALLRNLERSQRAETVARRKAVEHQESQERQAEQQRHGGVSQLRSVSAPIDSTNALRLTTKRSAA
jgi:hypothetical protein